MGAVLLQIAGVIFLCVVVLHGVFLLVSVHRQNVRRAEIHERSLALLCAQIRIAQQRFERQEARTKNTWHGYRKFRIRSKRLENEIGDICSFELAPHDGHPLPPFEPGQFLTFKLDIPDEPDPLIRCYSLSDCYRWPDQPYRVTIKKIPPPRDQPDRPPGKGSSYFHDQLKEGDLVDVEAPRGSFVLSTDSDTPVVLIAGGVGITPLLSMLSAIVESGWKRETWLFYGVRNRRELIMTDHLDGVRERLGGHIRILYCVSDETEKSEPHPAHVRTERVTIDLLRRELGGFNYDFYLCGPPPMMEALIRDLGAARVPENRIHMEEFGPGTDFSTPTTDGSDPASGIMVDFSKSNKEFEWDPRVGDLLSFALKHGIRTIKHGCRKGDCRACMTAVLEGDIKYRRDPGCEVLDRCRLLCIGTPVGNVKLDA